MQIIEKQAASKAANVHRSQEAITELGRRIDKLGNDMEKQAASRAANVNRSQEAIEKMQDRITDIEKTVEIQVSSTEERAKFEREKDAGRC